MPVKKKVQFAKYLRLREKKKTIFNKNSQKYFGNFFFPRKIFFA